MERKYRRIINVASVVITVVGFVYIINVFANYSEGISHQIVDLNSFVLAIALLCSTVAGGMGAWIWYRLLLRHGVEESWINSYWAWSISRLYRYIPGKIFGYLSRLRAHNTYSRTIVGATLSEISITYLPILLLLSIQTYQWVEDTITAILISTLIVIVMIIMVFMRFLLNTVRPLVRSKKEVLDAYANEMMPAHSITKHASLVFLPMSVHAYAFMLIANSIEGSGGLDYVDYFLILYLSGLAGQLSIIVPGGVGVREAAMSYMLISNGVMGAEALLIALTSRVVHLVSELLNVVVAALLRFRKSV